MTVDVVAIDGPAGVGKSTLARRLAQACGLAYLNTGVMYRALALEAHRNGVSPDDAAGLARLARGMTFDMDSSVHPPELSVDGRRPGADLTAPEVESSVSAVSRHPEVREVLRAEQRRLASAGAVVEGRDIGTVVTPGATLKLFLRAHPRTRAGRRARQRRAEREMVAEAIGDRDRLDARTNPFVPATDAVVIDTTELSADEVFARAMELAREREIAP